MAWWRRKPVEPLPPIEWHPMFAQLLELGSFEAVLDRMEADQTNPMVLDDGTIPLSWP